MSSTKLKEAMLHSPVGYKTFQIKQTEMLRCCRCGGRGHSFEQCPTPNESVLTRLEGADVCCECGQIGHKSCVFAQSAATAVERAASSTNVASKNEKAAPNAKDSASDTVEGIQSADPGSVIVCQGSSEHSAPGVSTMGTQARDPASDSLRAASDADLDPMTQSSQELSSPAQWCDQQTQSLSKGVPQLMQTTSIPSITSASSASAGPSSTTASRVPPSAAMQRVRDQFPFGQEETFIPHFLNVH